MLSRPVAAEESTDAAVDRLTCSSVHGEQTRCAADVSGGAALIHSNGDALCLLGRTWGYDDEGVWVREGCSGEFALGRSSRAAPVAADRSAEASQESSEVEIGARKSPRPMVHPERPTWGAIDSSGLGVLLYSSDLGEVALSPYALVRYIDQRPAVQNFVDHLGVEHAIDTRRDIQFHRAMVHVKGWFYSPKLRFQVTTWTVMSTDQTTLYGFIGYQFAPKFNLYAGINTLGGSRSVMGSHPFWLANDRVMADEYFRGSFSGSLWANGEILPGLWYHLALANNLSQLGVTASQLTRDIGKGYGMWWMPTTREFGPHGSYGDWEYHERLAARFGFSHIRSRETSQELSLNQPDNTQVRLADSLLLFVKGSLAPGVSVREADWNSVSIDAGFKYRGIFVQAEGYRRWLDHFQADGPLPVNSIKDDGYYVQAAFFPIKQKLEIYGATSWVYGDRNAGYRTSHEYIIGGNYYPFDSRNFRVNFQYIDITRSSVNSTFGFYVGGQTGETYSVAASIIF